MEDREMHKATCSDCGAQCEVPFKPTEGKPVRCKDCFRKSRPERSFGGGRSFGGNRGFGGGQRFDRPREMHKATCADCGKQCEVPFKPTEGKPVLCKECYLAKKDSKEF
jgi:CxxC-x17-CxxC domain-containing protein